jgi:hypothetical protein
MNLPRLLSILIVASFYFPHFSKPLIANYIALMCCSATHAATDPDLCLLRPKMKQLCHEAYIQHIHCSPFFCVSPISINCRYIDKKYILSLQRASKPLTINFRAIQKQARAALGNWQVVILLRIFLEFREWPKHTSLIRVPVQPKFEYCRKYSSLTFKVRRVLYVYGIGRHTIEPGRVYFKIGPDSI